ncbi:MAG: Polyprenyl synthetase, partial [Actinomycetota bacterium]|nr:Polyprenyl synthetase [Actinomycetota bacterium]
SEEVTGKSAANDIRHRKKSLPIVFAFREADPAARARLRDLYAGRADLTPDEEGYVRLVLEECHAEEYAQDQAERYRRRAAAALSDAAGGEGALDANPFLLALQQLGEFVTARAS